MAIFSETLSTLTGIIVVLALLTLWREFHRYYHRLVVHQSLPKILGLLNPPRTSIRDLLEARAISNRRLIRAFALTNTFVSSDISVHTAFVGRATKLLKAAMTREWGIFLDLSIASVAAALHNAEKISFDVFVQDVTMRAVIVGLLGVDLSVEDLDADDIRIVSSHITSLWSLSKKPSPISPKYLPELNYRLRRLIPDHSQYANPLDFLIPAWETLWRVVASCVAYGRHHPDALHTFYRFYESPTFDQFSHFDDTHPSVEWLVYEAMRLNPPTKRISRAYLMKPMIPILPSLGSFITSLSGRFIHHESADIESVLLASSIWGSEARTFQPLRFHPSRITKEQEIAKGLPFGYGRHKCVAAGWAPMAAGIITAAILSHLQGDSEFRLVDGEAIGGREGWQGWSVVNTIQPTRDHTSVQI